MSKKTNKMIVVSIAFILMLSMLLTACGSNGDVIAKVNGEEILKSEFEENFQIQKKMIENQYGSEVWTREMEDGRIFEEVFKEKILDGLVKETIILQEAKKEGIKVTDEEVDTEIESFKDANGGEENFNKSLEQNGITIEYLRNALRKDMIINQYQQKYISGLQIEDEEATDYFEEYKDYYVQVKVRHILVETKEEADEIVKQLNEGKDFGELAMEKSIDPGSASRGGVYDYFTKGTMVPEFEEVAFTLDVGKISDPVKTDYGYHIIKVEDRKETFEQVKDIVMEDIKYEKFNEKIEELSEAADVETFLQ